METRHRDGSAVRLRVRGLECRRGERTLFSGVEIAIGAGEIVWIRGANGQGKTTLLRTLAGLSAPEAGEIAWAQTAGYGGFLYLAHANALKEDLTVAESLRFLLRLGSAAPAIDELDIALARFGMASRRHAPVRTLSQGQRRRVALARLAVAATPATWLLDEPFDALDSSGIDALNTLLVEHARRGGSVVLTSHVPLTITDPEPFVVQLDAPVAA
ncbi:MAG: cytochrome c biogenesis heme-transporting ATPase CcmA [Caldimonas sp.]